ncbi:MAG: amidophosphoribosyltransferase [Clostridia bacterium]|jgi:amidophosphoribosyltransferase|nr:amidophosphoribosyltransferase [Clostridia bacterium]MDD4145800.1 amidophosphoribosyltransferase [Clostridia bacterium]MDD4665430.1 amidophosphoribosyltransferase [Clostridia bacterium]
MLDEGIKNSEAEDFLLKPDKMEEACGVFGIYGQGKDVARLTYYALYALQHRGQQSAGIAVSAGAEIKVHKKRGLVSEVFTEQILADLTGHLAIGHVQYSAKGSNLAVNSQPLVCHYLKGNLAVAHNGNLINAQALKEKLAVNGSVFQSTIDAELIANLLALYGQGTLEEALMKTMIDLKGSYALVIMTEDKLIGVRDPYGNRPLCLGKLDNSYLLASESCAFDVLGAELIRDVAPGEIVVIDQEGLHSHRFVSPVERALCVFEFIYFARPDSNIDGINVMEARRAMGRELAQESPVDVDIVIPVPDSGIAGALGYAEALNLYFDMGLMKNRYIGRTFIRSEQNERNLAVRLKLNPVTKLVQGKKVAIVDDSIVRGTTSKKIVQMLRNRGAAEVHLLITAPPVIAPCYYGIDTSERGQLIAAQKSIEETRVYIGADSLTYLSLAGLSRALRQEAGFCEACLSEEYPLGIPSPERLGKHLTEVSSQQRREVR